MEHVHISVEAIMNRIVPITRFNKGEASKIFEEVKHSGAKIVLKNNDPICVLVTPEIYQTMVDALADYELAQEAERRLEQGGREHAIGEVMNQFGITQQELDDAEVEIE